MSATVEFNDSLTEKVLAAVFEVSNTLGCGFLEKVYERALLRELTLRGIPATAQARLSVSYKDRYVGEYPADLLVDGELVVELKCVERLANEHTAQCINYLRAAGNATCVCLLIFRSRKSNGVGSSIGSSRALAIRRGWSEFFNRFLCVGRITSAAISQMA